METTSLVWLSRGTCFEGLAAASPALSTYPPRCTAVPLAAGGQLNHADDELVVEQMRDQLLARMRSLGALQPPAEATQCLEVGEEGEAGGGGGAAAVGPPAVDSLAARPPHLCATAGCQRPPLTVAAATPPSAAFVHSSALPCASSVIPVKVPCTRLQTQPRTPFVSVPQAVNAYQRLSQLLRGEYPPGLLPPTPQGYIAKRVRGLAGGWELSVVLSCLGKAGKALGYTGKRVRGLAGPAPRCSCNACPHPEERRADAGAVMVEAASVCYVHCWFSLRSPFCALTLRVVHRGQFVAATGWSAPAVFSPRWLGAVVPPVTLSLLGCPARCRGQLHGGLRLELPLALALHHTVSVLPALALPRLSLLQRAAAWRPSTGAAAASGAASRGAPSCPPTLPWSSTCLRPTWRRRSGSSLRSVPAAAAGGGVAGGERS